MIFEPGNKIKYGQDFSFFIGIPSGIDFKIEPCSDPFRSEDLFCLTAYGYGQLDPHDEHSYGNGALYVRGQLNKKQELPNKLIIPVVRKIQC